MTTLALAPLALVETVLRFLLLVVCIASLMGIVLLVVEAEENGRGLVEFLQPSGVIALAKALR